MFRYLYWKTENILLPCLIAWHSSQNICDKALLIDSFCQNMSWS